MTDAGEVKLYRCDPLEARLSHRQCLANRKRAAARASDPSAEGIVERFLLRPCLACPGVFKLNGRRPVTTVRRDRPRQPDPIRFEGGLEPILPGVAGYSIRESVRSRRRLAFHRRHLGG